LNQTTSASICFFQELSRNTFSKPWLRFSVIASIFCGIAVVLSYFFNHYFLSAILFIITLLWGHARVKHLQRTKLLAEFKIPANIWAAFKQRHTNISSSSYPCIEGGFKDYLAIHMRHRNSYAMPSYSVDALFHLLILLILIMVQIQVQTHHVIVAAAVAVISTLLQLIFKT